ncbi:hypothetical protein LEMLEM_LOCUS20709 [Lemmus lemmus]
MRSPSVQRQSLNQCTPSSTEGFSGSPRLAELRQPSTRLCLDQALS